MNIAKLPSGFTLIELLVVLGIISVLATIGTLNVRGGVKAARNAKKQADLRTLESGLTIYFYRYNTYPTKGINAANQDAQNWQIFQTSLGGSGLRPPKSTGNGAQYCYYVDNILLPTRFALVATDFEGTIPANAVDPNLGSMNLLATSNDKDTCQGLDAKTPVCGAIFTVDNVGIDYCIKSAPQINLNPQ
jgi:prepilin-type N-terminal cleavage/methylation domain-containing protein